MFLTSEIQTAANNDPKLKAHILKGNTLPMTHGGRLEVALTTEEHRTELRAFMESLGLDYDEVGNTYLLTQGRNKDKQPIVKCYAPRLQLRLGTLQLRWGQVFIPVSELATNESLTVVPQVIQNGKYTNYLLSVCDSNGYEVVFRLFLKDGVKLNNGQLSKMVKSGEGWADVMSPERPTDIKKAVTATHSLEFEAIGYREYTQEGDTFSADWMVLEADDGESYQLKAGKSQQAQDFRYWGMKATPDNPIKVSVKFEGLGDYNGKAFNKVIISYVPVNGESESLLDLLDINDDYSEVDEEVYEV